MTNTTRNFLRVTLAVFIGCLLVESGWAQSTTIQQGSVTQGSTMQGSVTQGSITQGSISQGSGGSGRRMAGAYPIALDGYCAVCILDMKKWVKGNPNFAVRLDGRTYLFPAEEQRKKFLANTTKYTPAMGGHCIVCAAKGKMVPGSVHFSVIHRGRLFLFPSANEKANFMAEPAKYENIDLAMGGMCTVCRVEMNKEVPGKPEFGTVYNNMRYYFPGLEQKKIFLSNPSKYAVKKTP